MEYMGQDRLGRHLLNRYFDLSLHGAWIDKDCATFPLWNLSQQLVGYQQYRPNADKKAKNDPRDGKYFTRLARGKVGVWGLESWHNSDTLFICEGVFDACKVTWLGYSGIALLSYDLNATTVSWLHTVRSTRKVVALCDNDSAGLTLSEFAHEYVQMLPWHDVGDTPIEIVKDVCQQFN